MCGRFTLTLDPGELKEDLNLGEITFDYQPRYNVAPTQPVAAVRDAQTRNIELLRWGLVPSWAKDITFGDRMINARSETLTEKPAFKNAYAKRRCLILADGFFEWHCAASGSKIPYYFKLKSGKPFAFAGLWESWRSPDGDELRTCTIITTTANALVAQHHERMPVILPLAAHVPWLTLQTPAAELKRMLAPYAPEEMTAYPVSNAVNSPVNDSVECIQQTAI
jgi:putative SOS response-associated peptidase YedK